MSISYTDSKLALGSETTLVITTHKSVTRVNALYKKLWQVVFQFERRFSRFIPMSELTLFNKAAGLKTPISKEFKNVLQKAKFISEQTNGIYNPFILPALQRAGYTKSFAVGYENDTVDDFSHHRIAPISQLQISQDWAQIPYGSAIDFGGCGKGYLADFLADSIIPDWVDGFWLSFGGDVVGEGLDDNNQPWIIHIQTPNPSALTNDWYFQSNGQRFAAATSSTQVRRGTHNGKKWHHIIDPRTDQPAQTDLYQVSVLGSSGFQTDVMATCAIIIGSSRAVNFLKRQQINSGLLLGSSKRNTPIERSFGSDIHHTKIIPNKSKIH